MKAFNLQEQGNRPKAMVSMTDSEMRHTVGLLLRAAELVRLAGQASGAVSSDIALHTDERDLRALAELIEEQL